MKQYRSVFLVHLFWIFSLMAASAQTADFVASKYAGCNPLDVTFTNKSTGITSATIYSWDFGDFKYSSLENPGTTYVSPGTYTVKLTVRNGSSGTPSTKTATITVYPSPLVAFTATPTTGCPCTNVAFTNTSTPNAPGAYTSFWSFGDGSVATSNNTSFKYCTPGTYTVALKVTNSLGCQASKIDTAKITIAEKPEASFTATKTNLCKLPDTVQFFASVSKGKAPYTYEWNFGDGPATFSGASPLHIYSAAGSYTVRLVVIDANGCRDTISRVAYIKAVPMNADFKLPTSVCPSNTLVLFENTSIPSPVATRWLWSDGGGSSGPFGQRHFWKGGTYTITMIDSFGPGCKDTAVKNYTVYPKPKPNFSYSPIHPCPAPATITFTNKSAPADTFTWLFGDGTTSKTYSPTHTYTKDSVYIVYLIQKNAFGCSDTFRVRDTTKEFPAGYPNPFYDSSNSPIIIRVYDMDMTFNKVQLNNCIPSKVDFSISLGKSQVLPATPDTAKLPACLWKNPFTFPFWFCYDTEKFPDPYPDPYPDSSYARVSMNKYPYPISTYEWDFGDGSPKVYTASPSHTFTTEGKFIVRCTITTANGCSFSDTTHVEAGFKPVANFAILKDSFCKSEKGEFENLSTGAIDYEWNFGDGGKSTDTSKLVYHSYERTGELIVLLIAKRFGCRDSMEKNIFVNPPDAKFEPTYVCDTPLKINFKNKSYRANRYSWDFGDGFSSTLTNPGHLFADTGWFNVRLIAYNDTFNCADTFIQPMYVFNKKPILQALPSCTNDTIKITVLNSEVIAEYKAWTSSISLDTPKMQFYIIRSDTLRSYLGLTYMDIRGCFASVSYDDVLVVARPKIKFSTTPVISCFPSTISFVDSSKNTRGIKNVSRKWIWGDATSTTSTGISASKSYTAPGSYLVTLIVTDTLGCKDSSTIEIESRKPTANFKAELDTFSCIGRPIKFYQDAKGMLLKYNWDFGDGTTSTAADPVHAYSAVGTYSVKLVVEDASGCMDSITKIAFVKITQPIAAFSLKDSVTLCPPLFATMINSSTNAIRYSWDFDNGSTSTSTNPTSPYLDSGIYNIRLVAFDKNGCTDTAFRRARVMGYDGAFKYDLLEGCSPLTVNFEADVVNVEVMVWDFADGTTISAVGNTKVSHTYTKPGTYLPRLILGDGKGCSTASKGLDTIRVDAVEAKVAHSPACVGELITLFDSSYSYFSNYASSEWLFEDGTTSILRNPTRLYNLAGSYPIRLISSSERGCVDTVETILKVNELPLIRARDTVICVGDDAVLSATGGVSYTWSFDPSLSCTDCNTPTTNARIPMRYAVRGIDVNGCTNVDTLDLGMKTKTTLVMANDAEVCAKEPIQLLASGAQRYEWSPDKYLNAANIPDPIAILDSTITYRVIGREGSCIPDTGFLKVTVRPLPEVDAGVDQKILAGNSAQLNASGNHIKTYQWLPSESLTCADCPSPVAKPQTTTLYMVKVKSEYGCSDSDQVLITVFCDQSQLFLPNTFTPNGDGQNDYFYPQGSGIAKIKSMVIYNRWGQKVYERTQFDANVREQGWDGTLGVEQLGSDTFVYMLEATCDNGETVFIKGDVTIIR